MQTSAKLVDMHGRPIQSSPLNRLDNGAGSLDNPSLQGWRYEGGSPDDDIVKHLPIVRQRVRDLVLNSTLVAGLIRTIVSNTVGIGLIPEPTPDGDVTGMSSEQAEQWKTDVMREWEPFAETNSCDACGRDNFYKLTQLALRSMLESGDVFAALPYEQDYHGYGLKIQLIEADCISDPHNINSYQQEGDIYGGVEVNTRGRVLAYWVATRHPLARRHPFILNGEAPAMREWVRVPVLGEKSDRRNILHLMHAQRPGQRRGIPLLAPAVEPTKMLDRYIKAELQSALIQTLFTAAIKTQSPEMAVGELGSLGGVDDYSTPSKRFYEENGILELGVGNVGMLAPGDDIVPVNSTHPTGSFSPFIETQIKLIGAACGVPYEMAMMNFGGSFSASRAAFNMAKSGFRVLQDILAYDFCQPIYEAFMCEAVASGRINAPGFFSDPRIRRAYCIAKWTGPGSLQIDPQKELDAYGKAIGLGLMTRGQAAAEYNGSDVRQNFTVLHEEQELMNKYPFDTNPLKVGTTNYEGGGNSADSSTTKNT